MVNRISSVVVALKFGRQTLIWSGPDSKGSLSPKEAVPCSLKPSPRGPLGLRPLFYLILFSFFCFSPRDPSHLLCGGRWVRCIFSGRRKMQHSGVVPKRFDMIPNQLGIVFHCAVVPKFRTFGASFMRAKDVLCSESNFSPLGFCASLTQWRRQARVS